MTTLPIAAFALILGACSPEVAPIPRDTFALQVLVQSDHEQPVQDAEVWLNGRSIGRTSELGRVMTRFVAPVGESLRVETHCPERYHIAGTSKVLKARKLNGVVVDGAAQIPVKVECKPTHRQAMIIVRTAGHSLPVLLDGEQVGQTSKEGVAHLLLEVLDGGKFEVSLDTSGQPKLEPQNPLVAFHVAEHDSRFVFDQAFRETAMKKPRKRRRTKTPEPPTSKPTRLESHKHVWKEVQP